jgi:hypothetical protein
MSILPGFYSFLISGTRAGSTLFREFLKSPTSFVGILTHITIVSANFSRIKVGVVNIMWMVRFMPMPRYNAFGICLISVTSKPDLFGSLFLAFFIDNFLK